MFLSAIAEVMSIGAVIPFIAVITDPDKMNEIALLGAVLNFFDITENQDAVLFFTVVFITLAIVSGIIRVFYIWIQSRLIGYLTKLFYLVLLLPAHQLLFFRSFLLFYI
jgi:ATP-binding cassette subfamily B protein